jgi:cell division septation protein DedD
MREHGPKIVGVLVLGAVGVFLSYFILELFSATFPEYAYRTHPDTPPNPSLASTPTTHSVPSLGQIASTPPAEAPPATPVRPSPLSTPTPLLVQESATTVPLPVPTPGVGAPSATATPQRSTHHASDPPASPAVSLGRPEYRVQAGAFKQREFADAVSRQLRANGYMVTLVEGALLRVWVGPAMSRTDAEHLAASLRSNGFEAFLSPVR